MFLDVSWLGCFWLEFWDVCALLVKALTGMGVCLLGKKERGALQLVEIIPHMWRRACLKKGMDCTMQTVRATPRTWECGCHRRYYGSATSQPLQKQVLIEGWYAGIKPLPVSRSPLSCTSFVAPLSNVIFLLILILSDACSNSEDVECLLFLVILILSDAWSNNEDVECLMFLVILILSDACSNNEDVECLMILLILSLSDACSNREDVECLMFLVILILSNACSNSEDVECLMCAGHTSK